MPSDQISTQCLPNVEAKATAGVSVGAAAGAGGAGLGAQLDFGLVSNVSDECRNIAPPPGLLNFVPEWKDFAFWNLEWEQPECIPQKSAPKPAGPVWTPDSSCSIVQPTTNLVPTTPAATPATPASTVQGPVQTTAGGAIPTPYQRQAMGDGNSTSSSPATYTGAASRPAYKTVTKSSLMISALALAILAL